MNIDKIKTTLLKDKKLLALGIIAVLVILFGGWYIFAPKQQAPQQTQTVSDELPKLSPEQIGLDIQVRDDQHSVKFVINKIQGISDVNYTLTYTAKHPETGADVPRGIIGEITQDQFGPNSIESQWLDLGSCSSGTCKYDIGVKSVSLQLKVTKDGKDYEVDKSVPIKPSNTQ